MLSLPSFLLRCRVLHFSVSGMVSTLDLFPCLLQTYLASFLLRCRVFHFSVSSMVSTLDLFPCLLQTYLASFLLRCRVFHFSVSSMVSTLDLFPCLLQTYMAPLRWTISSRVCISFCVYRSHTVDAYSTIGLTSELCAFYFVVVDPMFRFLRWDPSVLLALSHMLLFGLSSGGLM
jgi:hypothetical protein